MKKLLLLLSFIAVTKADSTFTVIVFPDMHLETDSAFQGSLAQANWVINQKTRLNIKYVVTVGDIVSDAMVRQQWMWADSVFKLLDVAEIPYAITTGNHDYQSLANRTTDSLNLWFPKTRLTSHTWWSGTFADSSKSCESAANTFTSSGKTYGIITIEAFPRDTITGGAKRYLDTTNNYYNILATHSYLDSNNVRANADVVELTGEDLGDSLWKKLKYSDINCIISGDIGGKLNSSGFRVDYTRQKTLCNQFNNDYQLEGTSNWGRGYLRVYMFKPDSNRIEIRTYSPYFNTYSKTDYRDNFATYMFSPDSIGRVPNKKLKWGILPSCVGYTIDSTTGSFSISSTANNKNLVYLGPSASDTDYSFNLTSGTYANKRLLFNGTSTYISPTPGMNVRTSTLASNDITMLFWYNIKTGAARDIWGSQEAADRNYTKFYHSLTPLRFRFQRTGNTAYSISKSMPTVNNGDLISTGFRIRSGVPSVFFSGVNWDSLTANITTDTISKSNIYGFAYVGSTYFDTAMYATLYYDTSLDTSQIHSIYNLTKDLDGVRLFDNNFLVDSTFYKLPTDLVLAEPTVIIQNPSGGTLPVGSNYTDSITATGEGTISYQWQLKHLGDGWIDTMGDNSIIRFRALLRNQNDSIRCIVSGNGGLDTSLSAYILLTDPIESNGYSNIGRWRIFGFR